MGNEMAIKCGNGHEHATVAEVRECYGFPASANTNDYRPNKYESACVKCGNVVPEKRGRVDRNAIGKWEVSHLEGQCLDLFKQEAPAFQGDTNRWDSIPRGHYATKSATGNNDFDFWRVDRPEAGTYAGRTFVKRIVGGKPDMNVSRAMKIRALEAILAEGVDVCGFRYGQELGNCRYCNRHLTDELSRSLSAGPECRSKH
jgi:hypothetical protein